MGQTGRMKRGIGFGIAWVGATAVAILIAAAAVGSVRSQVTEVPTRLGSPSSAALAATPLEASPDQVADPGVASTPTAPVGVPPTTAISPAASEGSGTTVPTESTPPTSTTPPTSVPSQTSTTTTTSTTVPPDSYSKTYDTEGGWVTIIVSGEDVTFGGGQPATGWTIEVEDYGPDEVEVHFEENDGEGEVEFEASFEDGELEVSIE